MEETPVVWVFAEIADPNGRTEWRRMTFSGDDHQQAANQAAEILRRCDVREVMTFSGPPRRWRTDMFTKELLPT